MLPLRHGRKERQGLPGPTRDGLGPRIDVTIDEARKRATAAAASHDSGHDPIAARKTARTTARAQAQADAKRVTFRRAAKDFLEANALDWKHRYARAQWESVMERYAFPVIGSLALENIGSEHVAKAMTKAELGARNGDSDGLSDLASPAAD